MKFLHAFLFVSLLFGAIFAQSSSTSQTATNYCSVNEPMMEQINSYLLQLSAAQEKGDKLLVEDFTAKITALKEQSEKERQKCIESLAAASAQENAATPTSISAPSSTSDVAPAVASPLEIAKPTTTAAAISAESSEAAPVAKPAPAESSESSPIVRKPEAAEVSTESAESDKPPAPPEEVSPAPTGEVGEIAYWWGKVSRHKFPGKDWETDPDGVSGANDNQLEYCKKWFPQSTGVVDMGRIYLTDWKDRGNLNSHEGNGVLYSCTADGKISIDTPLVDENTKFPAWVVVTSWAPGGQDIVRPVNPTKTSEVTEYYRAKMGAVMASDTSTDSQITSLKQLRSEIDSLIEKLLSNQQTISAQEVKPLVDTLEVSPGVVKADNVAVSSEGKVIEAQLDANTPVQIEASSQQVTISDGTVEASAPAVSITSEGVMVGSEPIKVSPSEAAAVAGGTPVSVSIKQEGASPVYQIGAQADGKLFNIIPVSYEKQVTVDAQSGAVTDSKSPWWSPLVS